MTPVHGTEASQGRLGAVLRAAGSEQPVRTGRLGPWLVTTLAHARAVLTDPDHFDFVEDVTRQPLREERGTDTPARSPHFINAPVSGEAVQRGMGVFRTELEALDPMVGPAGIDAMQVLRRPVARSTTAAVLAGLAEAERNRVGDLVLGWIDALAPIVASGLTPRWSPKRRRERAAREDLHTTLRALGHDDPSVAATMLAAGIQVPIAAGAWLLVELAASPDVSRDLRDDDRVVSGVVWETLRLCSPSWITARVAREDVTLGDARITEGSLVTVSPLLLGRDGSLVPGPTRGFPPLDDFAPRRWDQDEVRPGAWLPFGAGPHTCPGRNLGLAQLTHLAAWAGRWRLSLANRVGIDQSRGIFPRPSQVTFERW